MEFFETEKTLPAAKTALSREAKKMFEYAGSLDSITLNAKVEGVAFELCCHDVLGWNGDESDHLSDVLEWLESATFTDLHDPSESQTFIFIECESELRNTLLDYHDGWDEPTPEKMDEYVHAYNAMAEELASFGCEVEFMTSTLGSFEPPESMETNGWSWFTVYNPDTASVCYEKAVAELKKFNTLVGLEGM